MCSAVREALLPRRGAPSGEDLALFHRTLAEMCRSDLPLARAFAALESDLEDGRLRDAVRALRDDVEAGVPLDEAYGRHADAFPPLYGALVSAGLAAGDLPAVLEEIAAHAAQEAAVDARIRKACFLPLVSGVFVLLLGAVLLVTAGPRLLVMGEFAALRGAPVTPVFTTRLVSVGTALVFLALVLGGVRLFMTFRAPAESSALGRAVRFRVPGLGVLRLHAALASVTQTLGLLVRRRVPLARALRLTAEAAPEPVVGAQLRVAAATAEGGAGLADAVASGGLFPSSLLWLLDEAEARGDVGAALADVADVYRARLDRGVDRFTAFAGPALEVLIGIVVLVLALSFLTPILEMAETIRLLSTRG